MKPLGRIRVASLQITNQKALARSASNFIKTPLVISEGVLYGLCAKRGQAAVGLSRSFRRSRLCPVQ
jgi:hypothetical protein